MRSKNLNDDTTIANCVAPWQPNQQLGSLISASCTQVKRFSYFQLYDPQILLVNSTGSVDLRESNGRSSESPSAVDGDYSQGTLTLPIRFRFAICLRHHRPQSYCKQISIIVVANISTIIDITASIVILINIRF